MFKRERALEYVNFFAAALTKGGTLLYAIFMVGASARHLSVNDAAALFRIFNFVAPLGVFQGALSTFIVRTVAHRRAAGVPLSDIREIPAIFRASAVVGGLSLATSFLTLLASHCVEYFPLAALLVVGFVLSIADQVRIGDGRSRVANAYLLVGYGAGTIAFLFIRQTHWFSVLLIAFVAYGTQAVSSIVSFLGMFIHKEGRSLFLLRHPGGISRIIFGAYPMFITSVASATLLNIPYAHGIIRAYPDINGTDIIIFRIVLSLSSVVYFMIQAIMPNVLVHIYDGKRSRFFLSAAIFGGGLLLAALCAGAAVSAFGLTAAEFWTGHSLPSTGNLVAWGVITWGWLTMTLFFQFSQMVDRPILSASSLVLVDLVVLVAPLFVLTMGVKAPSTLGLCCGVVCGVSLSGALAWRALHQAAARLSVSLADG